MDTVPITFPVSDDSLVTVSSVGDTVVKVTVVTVKLMVVIYSRVVRYSYSR